MTDFDDNMTETLAGLPGFNPDEFFMRQALKLAEEAFAAEEVPVGALVVHEGRVIGKGYNQRQMLSDPTAHAEILAITAAASALNDWRLSGCTLYVTLEPCIMCAGAIVLARIDRVVYAAPDPKAGAVENLYHVLSDNRLNHQPQVQSGVLANEASALLVEFFKKQRSMGKK
jgi:tRNA(adenine34) deaminase